MNHLRELLELDPSLLLIPEDMLTEDAEKVYAHSIKNGLNAMCFWLGDGEDYGGLGFVPELAKLPFPTCWLEFKFTDDGTVWFLGCLCVQTLQGISIAVYRKKNGEWQLRTHILTLGDLTAKSYEYAPDSSREQAQEYLLWIKVFCTVLNCQNVDKKETIPPVKLQKAREKKGGLPLFSFWTLNLRSDESEGTAAGGSHESPRLHIRRGHPRRLPSGKYIWVNAHLVGKKELGMVHKDYAVDVKPSIN